MQTIEDKPPRRNSVVSEGGKDRKQIIVNGSSRFYAKTGAWTLPQKERYLLFLLYHQADFKDSSPSNIKSLYLKMSHFLRTRRPNQCRLYHMKIVSYFQSISAIISYLSSNLDLGSFEAAQQSQQTENNVKISNSDEEGSEDGAEQKKLPEIKSIRKRKMSLQLIQDEKEEWNEDKELLKTDHTIRDFPQKEDLNRAGQNRRKSHSSNFAEVGGSPFSPFSFLGGGVVGSLSPMMEPTDSWAACHSLFLSWHGRMSSLMGGNAQYY